MYPTGQRLHANFAVGCGAGGLGTVRPATGGSHNIETDWIGEWLLSVGRDWSLCVLVEVVR